MVTIAVVAKIMVEGYRQDTHTAMVITMKATSWLRGAIFATDTASSTALIKTSGRITSTMVIGSITCVKERATVTIIMRTYTWVTGRPTNAMESANCLHANKTGTRVSGGMICVMEREMRHRRMGRRTLEPGAKIRSTDRER